jgi:putative addiction module CopG family antidote
VPSRKTRNVFLTPGSESFADGCAASGRYRGTSEVARAALRLLERSEGGSSAQKPEPVGEQASTLAQ